MFFVQNVVSSFLFAIESVLVFAKKTSARVCTAEKLFVVLSVEGDEKNPIPNGSGLGQSFVSLNVALSGSRCLHSSQFSLFHF